MKTEIEIFIQAIKERPCLYDSRHKDATDERARANAWGQICDMVGMPMHRVRARWKNLKDSYVKHLRSHRSSNKMLATYVHWRWARAMRFLAPHVRLQSASCKDGIHVSCSLSNNTARSPEPCGDADSMTVAEFADSLKRERESEPESEASDKGETSEGYAEDPLLTARGSRQSRHPAPASAATDDIDYLFLSYANTFRRLPSTKQVMLKAQLAQMFLTAELQHLDQQGLTTEQDMVQFHSVFNI